MVSYLGVVGMLMLSKTWSSTLRVPLIVLIPLALFIGCATSDDVSLLELRAQEINRTVMCPVCPGESIDQSQNTLSAYMRAVVNEKLAEGWSDGQIRDFFVERYGPSVLLEPPQEGLDLIAWVLPPIGVVGAGVGLFLVVRAMRRRNDTDDSDEAGVGELSEGERERYFRAIELAVGSESGLSADPQRDPGGSSPAESDRA